MILPLLVACAGSPTPPDEAGMVHLRNPEATGVAADFWIDRYEFPNRAGEKPRVYVNALQARAACEAEGKRLCTAAEWRLACEGPDGARRYGYGAVYQPGACHNNVALASGHTSMMNPEAAIAASGSYPRCTTPDGVVDLVGNAEEWVDDDWRGIDAMLEGGAWYTHERYADCSGRYSRQPDYRLTPDKRVFSAGFRCCWSDPAPTQADRSADREARLAASRGPAVEYDANAEAPLGEGRFIDLYEYPNRPGVQPMAGVSWAEAKKLCTAAGKRLCGAAEWERACGGAERQRHPYGASYVPNACALELDISPVAGSYLGCVSPIGARDMVGGVWEWTATPLDAPVLQGRPDEVLREIRGGSWMVESRKAVCTPLDGYPAAPDDALFPDVGFRCCRGPEPEADRTPLPAAVTCPADMVAVGDGCIDRYEHPGRRGVVPESALTFEDAQAACADRGRRLCTQDEWQRACAGLGHRRWPYGDTYDPDACHDAARAAAEGGAGGARKNGTAPDCVSPEGVYDLSGNVWEWTTSPGHPNGILHGGGWNLSAGLNQCHSEATPKAGYAGQSGARCCLSAAELRAGGAPAPPDTPRGTTPGTPR